MNKIYELLSSGSGNILKNHSNLMFKSALDKVIILALRIKPQLRFRIRHIKTIKDASKILIKMKELIDFHAGGIDTILSESELKVFELVLSQSIGRINIDLPKFIRRG